MDLTIKLLLTHHQLIIWAYNRPTLCVLFLRTVTSFCSDFCKYVLYVHMYVQTRYVFMQACVRRSMHKNFPAVLYIKNSLNSPLTSLPTTKLYFYFSFKTCITIKIRKLILTSLISDFMPWKGALENISSTIQSVVVTAVLVRGVKCFPINTSALHLNASTTQDLVILSVASAWRWNH